MAIVFASFIGISLPHFSFGFEKPRHIGLKRTVAELGVPAPEGVKTGRVSANARIPIFMAARPFDPFS
jgi:hypothetical protein